MLALIESHIGFYGSRRWLLRIHVLALTDPHVGSHESMCWLLPIHVFALTHPHVGSYGSRCWLSRQNTREIRYKYKCLFAKQSQGHKPQTIYVIKIF
jgi:hypothetical protein